MVRLQNVRVLKKRSFSSLTLASMVTNFWIHTPKVSADETLYQSQATENQVIDASQIKTGNEFIDTIAPSATYLANTYDLYASVMIAQAVLESGNGTSGLASAPYYNLFGIKGDYQGNFVAMPTNEQANDGTYTTITANFRSYPGYTESLADYAQLLSTDFYQGARKSVALNYAEATQFLTGRYATSLSYAQNLNSVIELYDLTRFDNANGMSSGLQLSSDGTQLGSQIATQTTSKIYTVILGDTLDSIGAIFNTTAEELIVTNALASEVLEVGQKLVINQIQRPIVTDEERSQADAQIYTIQAGDTLSEIAYAHQISLEDLMTWNQLTDTLIYPDNQLIVRPADEKLQNKIQVRETQLALESEYVGEVFNVPEFEHFTHEIKGDLNQFQVDYFSNGVWQSTFQKRTYDNSATATILNQLFDIEGEEQALEDGSFVKLTSGKTLNNLRYVEENISLNIINSINEDSISYFKDELKIKLDEIKQKINQTSNSEIVIRVNLTKTDATRYAVSWRQGNVIYTATALNLDDLISIL